MGMSGLTKDGANPLILKLSSRFNSLSSQTNQYILGCSEEITVIPLHRKNLLALRNEAGLVGCKAYANSYLKYIRVWRSYITSKLGPVRLNTNKFYKITKL